MNSIVEDILMHYGMPRRSGRYPYGSGENPYQHSGDFLSRVQELKKNGMSETDIAKNMGLTTTQLRTQMSLAKDERRALQVATAKGLREKGYSLNEIADKMGFANDSSVRSLLNETSENRMNQAKATADVLRKLIEEKGMIDVGTGVERELGVSKEKLNQALYMLELEGYPIYGGGVPQVTNPGKQTNIKVICPPGTEHKDIYDFENVHSVRDYISYDNGESFRKSFEYPASMDSKRLQIRYADQGGVDKDGVIELRRGVKDLSLGDSHYAQVRIMVDGTHYLKGMAVYSDNMPDGVDVIFNTNKKSGTPTKNVLKKIKDDPDNPFGSLIKEHGGQSYYDDPKGKYTDPITGKKQSLSLINKRAEEGDWGEWSKTLPSQFLSKQSLTLIKKQLGLAKADKQAEYDEICSLTNPTVKKALLKSLVNKQYLIVARGAAKSMYGSCLQNFFLNVDVTTTHQITTAPTMKQAEEVLSPIRTAITRSRGPFYKFLTEGSLQNTTGSKANRMKLASTKKGIENFLTGSLLEIRPMRIDKLQGLQLKVATVDEWLSGDIREDVIGAIEQGASKVNDYLIVAISSEGTVRNGAGDTIKMELMDILKGDYINPHVSIWWYKLDSIDEVADPDKWLKANPNLGKTVSYETYQLDVERAEKAPAARNDILAKRFGLPMEGYTYYFTYEETLPHRHRDYWQMPCSLGADLSQGDDFCAFTFLFPLSNGSFGIKTRNYISSSTLMKLPAAMRIKYDQFMKEGSLIVLEGTVLDMMEVYEDLDNHIIECGYDVRCFGYDPYNAKEFVERWASENGPFGIEKVIQGAKTESVPLGELKKLSEERMLLFDEDLMTFAMGNCITLEDTNGNRKLLKKRYEQKIDAVAAMMDAYIAYKANREAFE